MEDRHIRGMCGRRKYLAVYAGLASAMLGVDTATAQITLVPQSPTLVASAPQFIAAADFNRDGVQDVAVAGSADGRITVLLGGAPVEFASRADISVDAALSGIAAGDLNCDGIPDIAAISAVDDRFFVVSGNGDGTFNPPLVYRSGAQVGDLAIGNFDGQQCNDLVTLDQASGKVSVLLNGGANQGFAPHDHAVGNLPKRVATADLNGDGLDDIVAIGIGTGEADEVAVLLSNGDGTFASARHFAVAAGAEDLAFADFDRDGALDIAVLSVGPGPNSVLAAGSLTVLRNQRQDTDGKRIGTGFFEPATDWVPLQCPAVLRGVLIECTVNTIAAGDFDEDGLVDLAVSFSARPLSGSTGAPAGLVYAFAGRGDGSFDFSAEVLLDADAQRLAAGDFNGDGVTDVTVTEQGSHAVQLLRSVLPIPGHPELCRVNEQCETGFCVDGVCCDTACSDGQRCDIPSSFGTCTSPAPNGDPCGQGAHCQSGHCNDGAAGSQWSSYPFCAFDQFCYTGECADGPPNTTACTDGTQCDSGVCINAVCNAACSASDCPVPSPPPPSPTPTPCGSSCSAVVVGSVTGVPGEEVSVAVTFRAGDTVVAGFQNDISFDPSTPIEGCTMNRALHKDIGGFGLHQNWIRALMTGFDTTDPIPDGALLYTCRIAIAVDAAPGIYPLTISNLIGSDGGNQVGLVGESGSVTVQLPPPGATAIATRTLAPTATPTRAIELPPGATIAIHVGTVIGLAGETAPFSVTLENPGFVVIDVQNDITFDPALPIASRGDGKPDCTASAELATGAANFIFLPPQCVPTVSCTTMRAQFIAPNAGPSFTGPLLYSCNVHIADDAPPGTYPLTISTTIAADGALGQWPTTGTDGTITVLAPPGMTPRATWTHPPTPTATPTAMPWPTWTPWPTLPPGTVSAPVPVDAPCTSNAQCQSGWCVDGFCCDPTQPAACSELPPRPVVDDGAPNNTAAQPSTRSGSGGCSTVAPQHVNRSAASVLLLPAALLLLKRSRKRGAGNA